MMTSSWHATTGTPLAVGFKACLVSRSTKNVGTCLNIELSLGTLGDRCVVIPIVAASAVHLVTSQARCFCCQWAFGE